MVKAEIVVVGLGAMGSAALFQLATRGARPVGIDRFVPPHVHGSSHGETRITRRAIGEGANEALVPLVSRSHEIWRELEGETGESLFEDCGVLILSGSESRHPKKADFLDRTIEAARRFGIPHEVLGADEIGRRFPQFELAGDERGYFEPGGGFVHPERCISAQLSLATERGATVRTGEVVTRIRPSGQGVRIDTDRESYEADMAVVAAGAWNPGLLGDVFPGLRLHRQVLFWFAVDDPEAFAPGRFPAFIRFTGRDGENSYGFPVLPGAQGLKLATETFEGSPATPEEVDRAIGPGEAQAVHDRHIAGRFKGVSARCLRAETCIYTYVPDGGFLIDAHPASDRILFVSACSGHGFKHSAGIGEAAAEMLLDRRSTFDLRPFGRRRFEPV